MMFDRKKYPWNKSGDEQHGSEKKIYDGPAPKPAAPPDLPVMECVYAGPEYFSGRFDPAAGMVIEETPAVESPNQPDEGGDCCPSCGAPVYPQFMFCSECGTPLKKNNE